MSRIVVALGGNALALPKEKVTIASQFQHAREALSEIVKLAKDGNELVITHGNGPQVGAIMIRVEEALKKTYKLPLEVCVAESEGELGYLLEQSLFNALKDADVRVPTISVLTQVLVDEYDHAFKKPSKPIGPFYTADQAKQLQAQGIPMIEDAGRGYRRVVASPQPICIVEATTIKKLVTQGIIVIAAGGGGIPVIQKGNHLEGIEAVIDKDFASATLAQAIEADTLLIVTGVPCVYRYFNTAKQEPLKTLSVADAKQMLDTGEFAEGSMKPKIEAAVQFIQKAGKKVIITDPAHAYDALHNEAVGTRIVKEKC